MIAKLKQWFQFSSFFLCGFLLPTVPPSIHDALSSSDASVREHGAVTLNCNATGSAPLTVRWRREDNLPININRTYSGKSKTLSHVVVTLGNSLHYDLIRSSRSLHSSTGPGSTIP